MAIKTSGSIRKPVMERIYVKVTSVFDTSGNLTPRDIIWKDGRRFAITRVLDFRPGTFCGRRAGDRIYTVLIGTQKRELFFEQSRLQSDVCIGRWFVELPLDDNRHSLTLAPSHAQGDDCP